MSVCGMEKQSLSRFILTPSHVSSLCGCQMDFCVFITKPASVSDFFTFDNERMYVGLYLIS